MDKQHCYKIMTRFLVFCYEKTTLFLRNNLVDTPVYAQVRHASTAGRDSHRGVPLARKNNRCNCICVLWREITRADFSSAVPRNRPIYSVHHFIEHSIKFIITGPPACAEK